MKIFVWILGLMVGVHAGFLPHLEAPLFGLSHQVPESKVIKLISATASVPNVVLPPASFKIIKVIHDSGGSGVLPTPPLAGPSKIIKVIQQTPVPRPKIIKVISHPPPVAALTPTSSKLLKVVQEYAPKHYAPAPVQSTKILKIIKQKAGNPHPVPIPADAQNVKVFKVYKHLDASGGVSLPFESQGPAPIYASNYGHGYSTPSSTVNLIKVLAKPVVYPTKLGWNG